MSTTNTKSLRRMRAITFLFSLLAVFLVCTKPSGASTSGIAGIHGAEETPECYDLDLIPRSTLPVDQGQRWLVRDFFEKPQLGSDYQLDYGRGSYGVARSRSYTAAGSFVYELPPSTVLANDSEVLNIDPLGRPYAPSLLVARPWKGKEWTFDTQVTYGAAQSCNACNVFLWIAFDGVPLRHQNSVRIQRSITGNPQQPGELSVAVFDEAGNQVRSSRIPVNGRESYFFRVIRDHRKIEIQAGSDGVSFDSLISHVFGPPLDNSEQQWLIANGSVFTGGCAYEAFRYFAVRDRSHKFTSRTPRRDTRWRMHGQPSRYIDLSSQQIEQALQRGEAVDVRFANIIGELNLNRLHQTLIDNQIAFRDSHFMSNVIGSYLTFERNVAFINCDIEGSVELYNSAFKGRADFSSSTFRGGPSSAAVPTLFSNDEFHFGADFSGATFKTKPTFRLSKFYQPASFWEANFEHGGDLSSVAFLQDVTFADFSFSKPDIELDHAPDMLFFSSLFCRRVLFISTFSRPNPILGHEISFQGSRIDELTFSGGTPDIGPGSGQEGPAMWNVGSGMSLREATVRKILMKDVAFVSRTEPVDLREISFKATECNAGLQTHGEPFQLVNVDFSNLRLSQWPVGDVLADGVSARRIASALEGIDPALARVSYFDLVSISRYYDAWRRRAAGDPHKEEMRDRSYDGSAGYKIERYVFGLFWLTSGYGTSFWRTMTTGLAMTLLFAIVFFLLDRGNGYLVKIRKPLELRTRFPETPVLSFGERALVNPLREMHGARSRGRIWMRGAVVAFLFSLNTVLKVGFGNLRVQTQESGSHSLFLPFSFSDAHRIEGRAPRALIVTSWVGWAAGYLWYLLLIYTVVVIPVLKGLF